MKPKILVIEDEPDTRANLCDILEIDGYQVETAGSFAEAFDQRNWSSLFAILLDRRLPDGSADDWLPKIREAAPQADVVIVTGHADLEGAINVIRHGVADYIPKPVNPDMLRMSLARIHNLQQSQKRSEQDQRLAAVGQMVTSLSHESRNLIQRIQASVGLLKQTLENDPDGLQDLAKIELAGDQLNNLLEEVRGYAAPIVLNREINSIDDVWRQAWCHLSQIRKGRDVTFTEHLNGANTECSVDSDRLEQVFRNLFENSLAACTDPGHIEIHVSDSRIKFTDALIIRVRDNGKGVTDEQKRQIFEPFFTTKPKGTGLGMAIVKRIVEAHGGKIAVGDAPGQGAEFVLTFPRAFPM